MAIELARGEGARVEVKAFEAEAARSGAAQGDAAAARAGALERRERAAAGAELSSNASGEPFYKSMPKVQGTAVRSDEVQPAAGGYAGAVAKPKAPSKTSPSKTPSKTTPSKTPSKTTPSKTTAAKTATSRELAFLDDPHTSIEDKLFKFMSLVQKQNDDELVRKMKEYEGRFGSAATGAAGSTAGTGAASGSGGTSSGGKTPSTGGSTGTSKTSGTTAAGIKDTFLGGVFDLAWGALKVAVPELAAAEAVLGKDTLKKLAVEIGAPVLGALSNLLASDGTFQGPLALVAKGMVAGLAKSLLPAALGAEAAMKTAGSGSVGSAGSGSIALMAEGVASSAAKAPSSSSATTSAATSSSSSTAAAAGEAGSPDEKMAMLELQRLVQKQQEMFEAVSNTLKSLHDAQMTAIGNIR